MISEHVFSDVPAGVNKQSGSECVICPTTIHVKYADHVHKKEILTFTLNDKKMSKVYSQLPEVP